MKLVSIKHKKYMNGTLKKNSTTLKMRLMETPYEYRICIYCHFIYFLFSRDYLTFNKIYICYFFKIQNSNVNNIQINNINNQFEAVGLTSLNMFIQDNNYYNSDSLINLVNLIK